MRIVDVHALAMRLGTMPRSAISATRAALRATCECEECHGRGVRGIDSDGDEIECDDCDGRGLRLDARAFVLRDGAAYECALCGFGLADGDYASCPSCRVAIVEAGEEGRKAA
jgi:hypothetical protein